MQRPSRARFVGTIAAAMLVAALPIGTARSQPVADFYRGKAITMIVGGEAGTTYDIYARLLSRYLVRYIPGNPTIIFQYMPGAGSVIATNHLYNVAPQDGTVILAPARTATLAPIMGQPGTKYDPAKLNWLGSLNNEVGVMQVWGKAPVKTIDDARKTEVIIGSTSPLTDSEEYPTLLNNTLGTKFKLVRGYRSITAVQIALEQGEVQGQENSFLNMVEHFPDWRRTISVLVQLSPTKHPQLPDVPLVFDYIKPESVASGLSVEEAATLWRIILNQQAIGRPYAVGPAVPADRVAALRDAFKSVIGDAAFRDEAAKSALELSPQEGADIQATLARVAATPPATLAKLRDWILYK